MEKDSSKTSQSQEHLLSQPPQEIAGISLSMRIPPFWRDKPRLWFISFEAATSDLKKSQAQLAQMVIAQLEKQDVEQISDLLYNPPSSEQYLTLKNRLISAYEESDSRQMQKLLSEIELGEQKPTQLLRHMRSLARDKVPDTTLRLMWTNHLPPHVRAVLAVSESFSTQTALDELALLADKMMEQTQQVSAISPAAHQPTQEHSSPQGMQYLIDEVRKLSLEVAELRSRPQYERRRGQCDCRRSRSRSRQRFNSSSRERSPTPSPFCYYHQRFGNHARRCTQPCSYESKSEN